LAGFLLRAVLVAFGLLVADELLPGLEIRGAGTLLVAGALLGVVNAFVRPVVVLLTLPLTILTLGLFLLVVNAAMIGLVAAMLPAFRVAGFWPALFGSLVVSVVSHLVSWFVGPRARYERLVLRGRA